MPFTRETLDFLVENRLRDSKEWFAENRERYNKLVLEPFRELVTKLAPDMLKIDDRLITEPRVDKTISRIYRDTRFSKDKRLYRDNCWCVFMRDKKLYMGPPAFYFEINPQGFGYGMGYYLASPDAMTAMRNMIVGRDEAFIRAREAYDGQNLFTLSGDSYKRSKYPQEDEAIRLWLDKKSISFNHESDDADVLFSDALADTLLRGFQILAPVYEFLIESEARK